MFFFYIYILLTETQTYKVSRKHNNSNNHKETNMTKQKGKLMQDKPGYQVALATSFTGLTHSLKGW